jgi:epoxide hydrolase
MNDIREFRIAVPQTDLDDLAARLAHTRWPDDLPGAGDEYGLPPDDLRRLVTAWQAFDWRAFETRLNTIPQFETDIDGLRVHFLHVRAADPGALPLLLTHGWPGSVLEFLDVLEPLSRRFHLVVPSIPGFGFSGPTRERGWDQTRVAAAWVRLMDRLGYQRFGLQGGDWGAGISRAVAVAAPERVAGLHLNFLPLPGPPEGLSGEDRLRVEQTLAYARNRPGYQVLHFTRPHTVAYALTDSPAGQLAWLAEWFVRWADPRHPLPDEVIVTGAAMYWLTRTAASSARLVKESTRGTAAVKVPVGVAVLPYDIVRPARALAERQFDIRRWTEFDRGGHFAALEVPELFAADVEAFFDAV